jgi:hypothetical protein
MRPCDGSRCSRNRPRKKWPSLTRLLRWNPIRYKHGINRHVFLPNHYHPRPNARDQGLTRCCLRGKLLHSISPGREQCDYESGLDRGCRVCAGGVGRRPSHPDDDASERRASGKCDGDRTRSASLLRHCFSQEPPAAGDVDFAQPWPRPFDLGLPAGDALELWRAYLGAGFSTALKFTSAHGLGLGIPGGMSWATIFSSATCPGVVSRIMY